jgi:hypothetical protein
MVIKKTERERERERERETTSCSVLEYNTAQTETLEVC